MSGDTLTNPYLRFERAEHAETGKTQVWLVLSRYGDPLGVIRWFGRWRQYAFHPEPGTVFNPGCLDTITANVRLLMEQRRTRP